MWREPAIWSRLSANARWSRSIYSGTMLVHRPGAPGVPITEKAEIDPKWAYPKSKARAEQVIREERGDINCVFLHLAGLLQRNDRCADPGRTNPSHL